MAENKTETAPIDAEVIEEAVTAGASTDVATIIAGLNNPSTGIYSSIKTDDFGSRLAIAAAMTSSVPVDENLGQTIALVNFIVQPVDFTDAESGVVTTAPRVVLIDAAGTAYHATSGGILSSLRNIVSVLGEPETWPQPVNIQVVEQKGRNGYKFFTIKFV